MPGILHEPSLRIDLVDRPGRAGVQSSVMEVAIAPEGLYLPALGDAERIASVYARAMLRSGALRFVARAGISRALHMGRYEAWAHRLLVRHAPGGAAHLVLVAVDPDLQGRGWAGRPRWDRAGWGCREAWGA